MSWALCSCLLVSCQEQLQQSCPCAWQPWHRAEQPSLFSLLDFFGWVWRRMAGELSWGPGTELCCCLAAPLNLLLHIRPDLMEERNKFL